MRESIVEVRNQQSDEHRWKPAPCRDQCRLEPVRGSLSREPLSSFASELDQNVVFGCLTYLVG